MKKMWGFLSGALISGALAAWVTDTRGNGPWSVYFVVVAVACLLAGVAVAIEHSSGDFS